MLSAHWREGLATRWNCEKWERSEGEGRPKVVLVVKSHSSRESRQSSARCARGRTTTPAHENRVRRRPRTRASAPTYAAEPELFVAQGDDGIDAHGTASGDVTGSQRNAEQNDAHRAKSQGIGRRNSIEQAGHEVREQKSGHSSGG